MTVEKCHCSYWSVLFFFLKVCISFKTGLACEGHTDKSLWVLFSCHFITFMLKHPSEFGGQSSAPFCWSGRLCQNMQLQKNVASSVRASQGQSVADSLCHRYIFFKKSFLKHAITAWKVLYNWTQQDWQPRRRASAVLLPCPFWKRENFKRRKISFRLVPSEVTPSLKKAKNTHICSNVG